MEKIEFTATVKIGDKEATSIEVKPLTFLELADVYRAAQRAPGKPEAALTRERIKHQAIFKAGDDVLKPEDHNVATLPLAVAKGIIAKLDVGQGEPGSVIGKGDGATTPILYKLGTPIEMKSGKGDAVVITELEFLATTYGEVEDVLAAPDDVSRALELLRTVAKCPEVPSLQRLPGWAIDRITTADGVGIMKGVLPAF